MQDAKLLLVRFIIFLEQEGFSFSAKTEIWWLQQV